MGEDDYFLYARFGQYLARAIEKHRAPRNKINRGFTVLNKMARASAKDPGIRQMLVSGPLEYIVDAPKARALARKRLSPAGAELHGKPVRMRLEADRPGAKPAPLQKGTDPCQRAGSFFLTRQPRPSGHIAAPYAVGFPRLPGPAQPLQQRKRDPQRPREHQRAVDPHRRGEHLRERHLSEAVRSRNHL